MALFLPKVIQREKTKIRMILEKGITLDGLVIDYHILKHFWKVINGIITLVLRKNKEAKILVNPRTDVLQLEKEIRASRKTFEHIFKIAEIYGAEIKSDKTFEPSYLEKRLDIMIKNLVQTHKTLCFEDLEGAIKCPEFFIPPYFVPGDYDDEWYKLTLNSIVLSEEKVSKTLPILAPIVVSKPILKHTSKVRMVVNDYIQLLKTMDNIKGYVIIPYGVNEYSESGTILSNIVLLASQLKKETNDFILAFTGEFGNVLAAFGVDAVSSGICWGRNPAEPTILEGIMPLARTEEQLYIHAIFRKTYLDKTIKLLTEKPEIYQCDCPVCSHHRKTMPKPSDFVQLMDTNDVSVHYAYWRIKELKMYHNNPDALLKDLEAGYKILKEYNEKVREEYFFLGKGRYRLTISNAHLKTWINVVRDHLR